jgi:hypothetical protein
MPGSGIAVVTPTDGASLQDTARRLGARQGVQYAEVELLLQADGSVSQPDWVLQKLQVAPVWRDYTLGNCSTVICHIDSGAPQNSNSWHNPGAVLLA